MKFRFSILAVSTVTALAAGSASATTYQFTVTCQQGAMVESWETGDIDPGKEYLRVMTGVNNPGCSVTDYRGDTDGTLPVTHHSGAGGVLDGIPPVEILRDIFGF